MEHSKNKLTIDNRQLTKRVVHDVSGTIDNREKIVNC